MVITYHQNCYPFFLMDWRCFPPKHWLGISPVWGKPISHRCCTYIYIYNIYTIICIYNIYIYTYIHIYIYIYIYIHIHIHIHNTHTHTHTYTYTYTHTYIYIYILYYMHWHLICVIEYTIIYYNIAFYCHKVDGCISCLHPTPHDSCRATDCGVASHSC